jgi:DNA repair and recombination protein RAD54B
MLTGKAMSYCHVLFMRHDACTSPSCRWRLLTAGTIEEKVYQRQMMKGDLAIVAVATQGSKSGRQFTRDELRQLFTLTLSTASGCETRDLLQASAAAATKTGALSWLDVASLADTNTALAATQADTSLPGAQQQGGWGSPQGAAAALQGMAQGNAVTAISVEKQQLEGDDGSSGDAPAAQAGPSVNGDSNDHGVEKTQDVDGVEVSDDARQAGRKRQRAIVESGSE